MKEAMKTRETNPSCELLIDSCRVEDLCLDMTCPGYPDVLLVPEGNQVPVTDTNLHEYVSGPPSHELTPPQIRGGCGAEEASTRYERGRSWSWGGGGGGGGETRAQVFPMRHLRVFSPEELELHVRGDIEKWDADTLRAAIQPDHGYSEGSLPVLFLTGSPTLPAGGIRRLNPRLTVRHKEGEAEELTEAQVVRKEAEAPLTADDYLPSVMTCANYLKLPVRREENRRRREGEGFWLRGEGDTRAGVLERRDSEEAVVHGHAGGPALLPAVLIEVYCFCILRPSSSDPSPPPIPLLPPLLSQSSYLVTSHMTQGSKPAGRGPMITPGL
eukprot:759141-Hanusia_phi.AAC.6